MSQNPDVGISMEIQFAREKFQSELAGMKADFDNWRQQVTGTGIEIPTRLRDEATTQLATLMQSLQAQAMAGISIPVNVGGGGFGGGGGFPGMASNYAIASAGALPMPLIQPMRGLPGPTMMPQFPGTFGMSRAEIDANISEAASAMTARQAMFDAAAGGATAAAVVQAPGEGAGIMRGLRLMAGLHAASQGIEAAYGSYQSLYGARDPGIEPGSVASMREEIKRIRQRREGFYGLTGVVSDFMHWAEPQEFGSDAGEIASWEKGIKSTQRAQREVGIESRLQSMGQGATDFIAAGQEALDVANAPKGLARKIEEIHRAAEKLADAYNKRADELSTEAAKSTSPTQKKEYMAQVAELRQQARTVPSGIADAAIADSTRDFDTLRQNMTASRSATADALGLSIDALRANLAGDSFGAALAGIASQKDTSILAAQNAYRASQGTDTPIRMADLQAQLAGYATRAGLQTDIAQRAVLGQYQQQIDAVGLAGAGGNQYEQQRQAVRQGLADALRNDPGHEGFHRSGADFMMFRLRQQESRDIQREYEFHDVMAASGEDHPVIGFNPGRTGRSVRDLAAGRRAWGPGNARRAAELDWEHQQQDRLAQHLGQDPQDRALRESMQENIRQEARRRAQNESDPQARERLSNISRYGLAPRASDQLDSKELAEKGNAAMADMAAAVQQGVENALKSTRGLYVVR